MRRPSTLLGPGAEKLGQVSKAPDQAENHHVDHDEEYGDRSHHRCIAVAQRIENLDGQGLHREAHGHEGDDVLVEAQHKSKSEPRDQIGQDDGERHRAKDGPVVGAKGAASLDHLLADRLQPKRDGDEGQRGQEDGMGDDHVDHLAVHLDGGEKEQKGEHIVSLMGRTLSEEQEKLLVDIFPK